MAKVLKALVFCSDKIPSKGNSTSGGGIRSFQIMRLLSSLGIQVSFVVPEGSKYKYDSSSFEFLGFYNLVNQTEFIGGQVYDMVWWCNPGTIDSNWCKKNPGILKCVDFHGPINLETILIDITFSNYQIIKFKINGIDFLKACIRLKVRA